MSPLVQMAVGTGAGLLGYLGPEVTVRLISAYRNRERFHPPSCYARCGPTRWPPKRRPTEMEHDHR